MIDTTYFWWCISLLALGTIAIRVSFISISSRVRIPPRVRELFSFVPAAILPALIAPMVFFHQGQVDWLYGKERLLVLFLATIVCAFTRHMLLTLTFGLAMLYVLTHT